MDYFYGFRVAYIFVTYWVLYATLQSVNNPSTILNTFILFLLPIAFDYHSQQPVKKQNRVRIGFCFWLAFALFAIIFAIRVSGININFVAYPLFKWSVFVFLVVFFVTALVDWIAMSSPEEVKHRQEIAKKYRRLIANEQLHEKVEHYEKEQKRARNFGQRPNHGAKTAESTFD
ncbi:hypothetical protein MOC68_13575 [Bacillus spizizenii]|nr:hypothetical protein [Bacillus spizizenii]